MPTGTVEPAQENLCDVADTIRGRLAEIHDCLDRVEGGGSPPTEPKAEAGGLEAVLSTCRIEADRAMNRVDSVVKRIGRL